MRFRTTLVVLALALLGIVLLPGASASNTKGTSSTKVVRTMTSYYEYAYIDAQHDCYLKVDDPYLWYYAPWNRWYVRSNSWVRCESWNGSHTIAYPWTVKKIDLYGSLWRDREPEPDIELSHKESHVTNTSLTSIAPAYSGPELVIPAYYHVGSSVRFTFYDDNYVDLFITPPPVFFS